MFQVLLQNSSSFSRKLNVWWIKFQFKSNQCTQTRPDKDIPILYAVSSICIALALEKSMDNWANRSTWAFAFQWNQLKLCFCFAAAALSGNLSAAQANKCNLWGGKVRPACKQHLRNRTISEASSTQITRNRLTADDQRWPIINAWTLPIFKLSLGHREESR